MIKGRRSLLRQLEFLQGDDETANCSIAKDTLRNEHVSMSMASISSTSVAVYIADIIRHPRLWPHGLDSPIRLEKDRMSWQILSTS